MFLQQQNLYFKKKLDKRKNHEKIKAASKKHTSDFVSTPNYELYLLWGLTRNEV